LYNVHFAAGNKLEVEHPAECKLSPVSSRDFIVDSPGTCDWCELSLKLNKDADGAKAGGDAKGKGKAKGDKKGGDDEGKHKGLSGLELYDLYLYVSLLPCRMQLTAENPPGS